MHDRLPILSLALLAAIPLAACSDAAPPSPAEENASGKNEAPGRLNLTAKQAKSLDLKFEPATAASEAPIAEIPAIIAPPPNARVAVAATFPGVVTRTLVVEGESVKRGQPLAIISSRDVLTMGADLSRASARLTAAQANADRMAQLSREGIIAGARAEEARAALAEARADASEKSRILRMVNGSGGSGTYTLTAPIAGRVTASTVQTGSTVDGTTAPYVIDAEGQYEAVGQLPERLAGSVRPGMAVAIGPDLRGRVTAVGSTIDADTRSVVLKARLPAGPGTLSGKATSLTLYGDAPADAVTVPKAAVTNIDGQDVVFVRVGESVMRRAVKTGGGDGDRMILLSGVKVGEPVVISGISELKALAAGE